MTGVVRNIATDKKFGFIRGDNGQEYFFHMSDMSSSWDGLVAAHLLTPTKVKVVFEPHSTEKGPRARFVNQANDQSER